MDKVTDALRDARRKLLRTKLSEVKMLVERWMDEDCRGIEALYLMHVGDTPACKALIRDYSHGAVWAEMLRSMIEVECEDVFAGSTDGHVLPEGISEDEG